MRPDTDLPGEKSMIQECVSFHVFGLNIPTDSLELAAQGMYNFWHWLLEFRVGVSSFPILGSLSRMAMKFLSEKSSLFQRQISLVLLTLRL